MLKKVTGGSNVCHSMKINQGGSRCEQVTMVCRSPNDSTSRKTAALRSVMHFNEGAFFNGKNKNRWGKSLILTRSVSLFADTLGDTVEMIWC